MKIFKTLNQYSGMKIKKGYTKNPKKHSLKNFILKFHICSIKTKVNFLLIAAY